MFTIDGNLIKEMFLEASGLLIISLIIQRFELLTEFIQRKIEYDYQFKPPTTTSQCQQLMIV